MKTNSLRLIYESTKALEIKTLIASNLVFASDAILSCFFHFFLIIGLYLLNPAVSAQIFNPTAEPAKPTGTPTNKANTEIQTQPLTVEMKRRRCSKLFKFLHIFYDFHILHHCFVSSMI